MIYKVKFVVKKGFAINVPDEEVGVLWVKKIRKIKRLKNVSLDLISPVIKGIKINPIFTVEESIANKSNVFKNINFVTVSVATASLNIIVYQQITVKFKNKMEIIDNVEIKSDFDCAIYSLLKSWEGDGFPLIWNEPTLSSSYIYPTIITKKI